MTPFECSGDDVLHRNFIKADRFAFFDLSRKYRLTTPDFAVLVALVFLADFRTSEWTGTLVELSEHVPPTRTIVAASCQRLADLGLITMVRPFRQNAAATIRVSCYEQVVVPSAGSRRLTTSRSEQ